MGEGGKKKDEREGVTVCLKEEHQLPHEGASFSRAGPGGLGEGLWVLQG